MSSSKQNSFFLWRILLFICICLIYGRLGAGTDNLSDIVNDVKVIVYHSSTALKTTGRPKHLRSSHWVLRIVSRKVERKCERLHLLRRGLFLLVKLLHPRIIVRLNLNIIDIWLKEVIIVGILRI